VRNPSLANDLRGGQGNLDVISQTVVADQGTMFALYRDHRVDSSPIPAAELQNVLSSAAYQGQVFQIFDLSVFYFGFAQDKPPFDNVQVRRAFSAILDRQAFVDQLRSGRGAPMIHFTPPGIAHAPPINQIGVGFNPPYAAAQLAEAGYPNCEGLPPLTIAAYAGVGNWGEFLAAAAEEHLGCDLTLITIEQLEFSALLQAIDPATSAQDRPHVFTLGWGPGYGDAHSWLNDVLSCKALNRFRRPCTAADDLIDQAARATDPTTRTQLYAEIEAAFFGEDGEFPMAPLFLRSDFLLIKPWYSGPFETDARYGGAHWSAQTVDMAAKLAAQR
jgi:ABC-type transport system substrate-binding protein